MTPGAGGAHHSKVVLRAQDPPVFAATGPKTKSSQDVLFAHSGKLEIDRGPVLQHGVAAESRELRDAHAA